jgi:AP-2 complex subunit sigma-1
VCVDANDNELAYLEAIHLFVEILGAFGLPTQIERCLGGLYKKQMPSSTMSASWTWFSISTRCVVTFGQPMPMLTRYGSQVYAILDEMFLAGEIEETSKDVVLSRLETLEKLE